MISVSRLLKKLSGAQGCHRVGNETTELPKILIVGSPNVGKTLLFNRLTGKYVTVSNYPGTTVEVSRGRSRVLGGRYEVIDTPGMYSLSPITEEEQVACAMVLGILPGTDIELIRRFPSFVFQVGYSQFTVDKPLAEAVFVHWNDNQNNLKNPDKP